MVTIIAAVSKNNVIGKNNQIPWSIPEDMEHFKKITMGKTVVMGRKTYESIGKPLKGRKIIVVSTTKNFDCDGVETVPSFEMAFLKSRKLIVAGGEKIYEEALPFAKKIYLTRVDMVTEGDAFFPEFDESKFEKKEGEWKGTDTRYRFDEYVAKLQNYSYPYAAK